MDNRERTVHAYEEFCKVLDSRNWHYDKNDENLKVNLEIRGDDLTMDIYASFDEKHERMYVISHLPFAFPEDRRLDGAIASSVINYNLVDGSFDYNIKNGRMVFRMTNSFKGCDEISPELFDYIIDCMLYTVDEYNDKFFMVSMGALSLDDFIAKYGD